jgi:pimeloyl-ACP methyl ester carboxylesterase
VSELDRDARLQLADALGGLATRFGLGAARGLAAALRLPAPLLRRLPLTDLRHLRAVMHAYASGGHDYRPALATCPVPITVFVGMRSTLYDPRGQLAIAELAPRASVVRFEDAGHLLAAQRPRAFVRALGAFLDAAQHS